MAETHGTIQASEKTDPIKEAETPDLDDVSGEACMEPEMPPTRMELVVWYVHGLCTYFVPTVLIPVIFPLIITQIASDTSSLPPAPPVTARGLVCSKQEMILYQRFNQHSISVLGYNFSALHWTALSWAAGIIIAGPVLSHTARHLDHGHHQPRIIIISTMAGATPCLLTGFFKTSWIFPIYIATIVVASTTTSAAHTRHLALITRGFTGNHHHHNLRQRRAVASWLALYVTAAGSAGAAVIATFTYHMLRHSDQLTSLWVVSIFSGLAWCIGVCNAFANRPGLSPADVPTWAAHIATIANHPHVAGSLVGVFLSSFASICVFATGSIFVVGELCIKPIVFLSLWILYFSFPMISLPITHPLQLVLRADAVQMQLLGFFMTAATTGTGFYYKNVAWRNGYIVAVALVQSTAVGILHAFGRVVMPDCSPVGKEGVFSAWLEWVRAAGACAGFTVAVVYPGDVKIGFGVSFLTSVVGILVLIFGNVSDHGGVVAVMHDSQEGKEEEERSTVNVLDREGEGMSSNQLPTSRDEEKKG